MVFKIENSLLKIEAFAAASGHFKAGTQIGEPTSPPIIGSSEFFGAVYIRGSNIVLVYADGGTREQHLVTLRVYRSAFDQAHDIEFQLAHTVSEVVADLLDDADLGNEVMSIDTAGM